MARLKLGFLPEMNKKTMQEYAGLRASFSTEKARLYTSIFEDAPEEISALPNDAVHNLAYLIESAFSASDKEKTQNLINKIAYRARDYNRLLLHSMTDVVDITDNLEMALSFAEATMCEDSHNFGPSIKDANSSGMIYLNAARLYLEDKEKGMEYMKAVADVEHEIHSINISKIAWSSLVNTELPKLFREDVEKGKARTASFIKDFKDKYPEEESNV
jgi:hypothetical protein